MTKLLLPLCAALILIPTAASAAPASDAGSSDEDALVSDGPVREYIFELDNVDGEVLKPDGVPVTGKAGKDHANMISIRGSFIPELIKLSFDV